MRPKNFLTFSLLRFVFAQLSRLHNIETEIIHENDIFHYFYRNFKISEYYQSRPKSIADLLVKISQFLFFM